MVNTVSNLMMSDDSVFLCIWLLVKWIVCAHISQLSDGAVWHQQIMTIGRLKAKPDMAFLETSPSGRIDILKRTPLPLERPTQYQEQQCKANKAYHAV